MFNFKFEDLEIKSYIPLIQKKNIIENIINISFVEENGIYKIDYVMKELFTILGVFINYTNKEIPELYIDKNLNIEKAFELYDYLIELGIYDNLVLKIDDIAALLDLLENEVIQKKDILNSIEGILANGINKLIEKLPSDKELIKMAKSLTKDLSKLNPEKMKYVNDVVSALDNK